jgi:hypothetical protein
MSSRYTACEGSCCSTASSPLPQQLPPLPQQLPPLLSPPPPLPAAAMVPVVGKSGALRESLRRDICGGQEPTARVWVAMMDEWGNPLGMQRVTLSSTGKILCRELWQPHAAPPL